MKTPSSLRQQKPSPSAPSAIAKESPAVWTTIILAAVVIGGVFAVYSPALNFQFILDDHRFVSDPRLQSPGHVWEYFTSYVWAQVRGGPLCFYRPLFVLWLRLNFILCGSSPWGWHVLSIIKHTLVAILLGFLAWKLLRERVAALIAGALFALHPAQTESVAWVTVPDPLMSAAILGTLLLYLGYADRVSIENQPQIGKFQKKSRGQLRGQSMGNSSATAAAHSLIWMIGSVAVCLAALMAKETAVVLPAVLFAMVLVMGVGKPESSSKPSREVESMGRAAEFRIRLLSAFHRTVPIVAITVVYLLMRLNALKGQLSPPTQHLPWSTVLLSWPATLWFYVKVLFWPVRSRAFADPVLSDTFSLRGVVLPALGV